jgi:hypothetical protein
VVNEIVVSGGRISLHSPVENRPEFSTPVDDTPTISWVLALTGTGYIVVEPVTSGKANKAVQGLFHEVSATASGSGVSTDQD